MARSRLLQEEREQAPGFLRWLGFALACWGVILTGSILVGVLVTFHELASPFTAPDIVAFLGELVVGVALFRSKRWGYRLGWVLAVYLFAFGALQLVAPTPEFSEPDLLFGSKIFSWVYVAPGALLVLALVTPASRRWHERVPASTDAHAT
jgi:peptidoglycan/LPS O-acetylase OafA/YrhL